MTEPEFNDGAVKDDQSHESTTTGMPAEDDNPGQVSEDDASETAPANDERQY
jgi:hypothetical protein